MQRVTIRPLRGGDQQLGFKVAIGGARWADAHGAIGHLGGETFPVRFGNHGDGRDP